MIFLSYFYQASRALMIYLGQCLDEGLEKKVLLGIYLLPLIFNELFVLDSFSSDAFFVI